MKSISKILLRYGAAALIVAAATLAAEVFYLLTHSARLSSIFLVGVLVSAFVLGSGPSFFATGLAFLIYMWLVDPRYQLSFGSAEDFNTLFVFLVVAVLTSSLTGRVRDEAARERARSRTTTALLEATQEFSASSDEAFIRARLAYHLAAAARGEAFVRDGENLHVWPPAEAGEDRGRPIYPTDNAAPSDHAGGWRCRPLRADGVIFGSAGWRIGRTGKQHSDDEDALLDVLADTGAAAIARARLVKAKSDAETRARTEDLRNALLSSISHDLRTPLAAIVASASSLHEFGHAFDPAVRRDLAATIQEEAERLDAFVANLLSMTKLESGALAVQTIAFSLDEVVARAARRQELFHRRWVARIFETPNMEALGDPMLFEQALSNVIDNALRYSLSTAQVIVTCSERNGAAQIQVVDEGSGVPPADEERIFEKFYRAPNASRSGTGLGLSITRGLIEGMGGALSARNRTLPEQGLVVTLTLPLAS